jgi:heat shock protein HtpX
MQAIGLSTRVWNNNWKCALLLAGFPVLLALLFFGLGLVLASQSEPNLWRALRAAWRWMPQFLLWGGIAAAAWFLIAWRWHQRLINGVTGAREVTRQEEPLLWNELEALCISRGERMPKLAVMETEELNAFASGLSREAGQVTVTRGLLNTLERDELRAVLAHELAHIRGGDARLAVVAAIFAGMLTFFVEMFSRARIGLPRSGGSSNSKGSGAAALIGVLLILLAAFLGTALRFALSRNREFQADAEAVRMTGDANGMIRALRRIEGRSALPRLPSMVRAMMLDDAQLARGPSLWATHPPVEQRVQALVRFAGGQDPGPLPVPAAEGTGPWAGPAADSAADPDATLPAFRP